MTKLKVKVGVIFDEEGNKIPQFIEYNDHKYDIDRVITKRFCPSFKLGGIGERYTIRIREREYFLFFEEPLWWLTPSNVL